MNELDTIENALIHDKVEVAGRAALSMFRAHGDQLENARGLGAILEKLYREFRVEPVHDFYEQFVPEFPPELGKLAVHSIEDELKLTIEWNRRLDDLANERLANEILEYVKANDIETAEKSIIALLGQHETPEHGLQRARQIGSILGSLVHEQSRAEGIARAVVRDPHRFGINSEAAMELEHERQRSANAAARRERPVGALSRVELTQATVELGRALPGRMAIHEPNPEDYAGFDRAMRAIIRCCLLSFECNKYNEATMLMVEFSPKELSTSAAMAGVEQRLYPTLGRTARSVAAKVFRDLGRIPRVLETYMDFSRAHLYSKIGRYAVETLGLFRNPASVPFIVQAMSDRKASVRTEAIFALGTIGDDRGQKILFDTLRSAVSGRVIEGEQRREAMTTLSALARLARSMPGATRTRLIAQILKIIPRDDTPLVLQVLLNFFSGKIDGIEPALLRWAAQVATASLWNIERPDLIRAARQAPLGFRQPLIDLLERLAPHAMEAINDAAMSHSKTYGGAYLALGEFYGKTKDPSTLPVLKHLLFNTFLHDDTARRSAYKRETVYDPATEESAELSKDKVLASLIYAIDAIGGDEAQDILSDIFEQIQSGRLPRPGQETSNILMEAHMRSSKRKGVSAFPTPPSIAEEGEDQLSHSDHIKPVTDEELELMNQLRGSYLFAGRRREKKVGAMAALAQRKLVAALPEIVGHLTDKDSIISAAAVTALLDFGAGRLPPNVLNALHTELLKALESDDNGLRVRATEVLTKLGPRKSPLKERLHELAAKPDMPLALKAVLPRLLGSSSSPSPGGGTTTPRPGPSPLAGSGSARSEEKKPSHPTTELEKKRAYLLARQEWIRNGKRGDPPEPPK